MYLIPPGKEAPKEAVRDVSSDMLAAKKWIKDNVKDVIEVHEARKLVQEQFPSLVNDEAFACVMEVKEEWTPKEELIIAE
jgi:hypothetical protein